jgi:aminoglycoside 6'-N-acetyltransferase I
MRALTTHRPPVQFEPAALGADARIEPCASVEQSGWLALRKALWPGAADDEHLAEMASFLAAPARYGQFIAYRKAVPVGMAEVSVRHDYVNGTSGSPVAFLEGLYVLPGERRGGIGAALVATAAAWGSERACAEFASDAPLENRLSHAVHRALGFEETERVVYFRRPLP